MAIRTGYRAFVGVILKSRGLKRARTTPVQGKGYPDDAEANKILSTGGGRIGGGVSLGGVPSLVRVRRGTNWRRPPLPCFSTRSWCNKSTAGSAQQW